MADRCPRCGANFKPACRGCEHNVSEINQRWVEEVGRRSYVAALAGRPHRLNQIIRYAGLIYRDEEYFEGTDY